MEMTLAGAVLAGLLSFASPCVLPMVPFWLAYLGGLSVAELRGGALPAGAQGRLVVQSAAFALGVTAVFVLLGLGATAAGRTFAEWRGPLSWAAAAVLALFGLHFLGLLRLPFLVRQAQVGSALPPATLAGAFVMGLAFGFGWTPCVGPALAAILVLAAGTDDFARGAGLLLAYGLAMTLPFVATAAFAGPVLAWASRRRALLAGAEAAMGVMLLVFAALVATDSVSRLAEALLRAGDWSATLR